MNHPADFVRKGSVLLEEVVQQLSKNKGKPEQIKKIFNIYDSKIKNLIKSRSEWNKRDYVIHNIETTIIGGIVILFFAIGITLILEKLEVYSLPLSNLIKIYIMLAIGGGIAWSYFKGPKDLSASERGNESYMKLYESPIYLWKWYKKIKDSHEEEIRYLEKKRMAELKQEIITRNEDVPARTTEPVDSPIDNDQDETTNKKKKKKKKWGLSEGELEERRSMLSMRFLMKVAKLKKSSDEEVELPKVLFINSSEKCLAQVSEIPSEEFILLKTNMMDEAIQLINTENPRLIIIDAEMDVTVEAEGESEVEADTETEGDASFLPVEILKKNMGEYDPAVVVFKSKIELDDLIRARELDVVDIWEKHYDSRNEIKIHKERLNNNINFVLKNDAQTLKQLLDRKIIKREIAERKIAKTKEVHKQENRNKVVIASRDYTLVAFLKKNLAKFNIDLIIVSEPKEIVGLAVTEKPKIVIVDDNLVADSIYSISKMLNIRTTFAKLVLILSDEDGADKSIRNHGLKILNKYYRPYDHNEIFAFVLSNIAEVN